MNAKLKQKLHNELSSSVCIIWRVDFIVLQVDDGTYVYVIDEVDIDNIDSFQKNRPQLFPSKTDVVGKLNPIEYYHEVGAEIVEIKSLRNNKEASRIIKKITRDQHKNQQTNQLENLQTAINEIQTATTLANSILTNSEPDTGQLLCEITDRQEQ